MLGARLPGPETTYLGQTLKFLLPSRPAIRSPSRSRSWSAILPPDNCGSSRIKFALFDADRTPLDRTPLWNGKVDGITGPAPTFGETGVAPAPVALDPSEPYPAALAHIAQRVDARRGSHAIRAIAHRVVHGGNRYFEPVRIDAEALADLRSYIPLALLHQPFALEAMERLLEKWPELPHVACFDTAFHHTLPDVERMPPLSRGAWERAYGAMVSTACPTSISRLRSRSATGIWLGAAPSLPISAAAPTSAACSI